jgi:hypothetical protein
LAENFKMRAMLQIYVSLRWRQWCSKKIATWINWTHSCVVLLTREVLITFYASLPVPQFSELRKLAQNLASVFGSHIHVNSLFTYEIKQTEFRLRITDVHSYDVMRIDISKTPKFHINKFSLG